MAAVTLTQVNELPSPTWNHLQINGVDLVVPAVEGYDPSLYEKKNGAARLAGEAGGAGAPATGRPAAADVPAVTPGGVSDAPAAQVPEDAGQAPAANAFDAPEASKDPTGPWAGRGAGDAEFTVAGGCGAATDAWIVAAADVAQSRLTVEVPDYERVAEPIVVDLAQVDGIATVDVTVGRGAAAQVVLVAGRDVAATQAAWAADGVPAQDAPATRGWLVRVDAAEDATVELVSFVAPGAGVQMIDDTGIRTAPGAHVDVRQFYLGSQVLAAGFAAELAGERSSLDLDARYVGRGTEELDFGYAVRNRGPRTVSELAMHGVLADAAHKSLRTTIDLMHGAKGASGVENEGVILAGDDVVNKSLPVILCDEDDVAGTHGASIGEVDPDQLAYLAMRGIDGEEARALLMEATYAAALDASVVSTAAHGAVLAATVDALGAEVAAELDANAA